MIINLSTIQRMQTDENWVKGAKIGSSYQQEEQSQAEEAMTSVDFDRGLQSAMASEPMQDLKGGGTVTVNFSRSSLLQVFFSVLQCPCG